MQFALDVKKTDCGSMTDNRPISQIYAEEGDAWAEAEARASILEDTKGPNLSELALKVQEQLGIPFNRAEAIAKGSKENRAWILQAIDARREANKLRVRLESVRMKYGEWQSQAANERLQAKL